MKISELMIGDWVEYEGKYHRVNGIIEDQFCRLDSAIVSGPAEILDMGFVYLTDTWERVWVDSLKPVPLTETMLEVNGWEKARWGYHVLRTEEMHSRIRRANDNWRVMAIKPEDLEPAVVWRLYLDFNYVHELQHALLLLGFDKELTIPGPDEEKILSALNKGTTL